ncbi:MAG: hypothetical protein JSU81_09870 [Candidatus Coatesbacteria bacterium]|nr:MAG: hypothetical protein JSU81_09870 [Candidatus Coatesbacteria bacterium]
MRKVALLLTAALVLAVFAAPAGATGKVVTIGAYAANNYIPWWGSSYNSMRFQCLWMQSDINYAGYINKIEWNRGTYTTSGLYREVRVWLCHTTKTALEATFNNNYTGNTPVLVRASGNYTLPGGPNYVDMPITPNRFNYNNTNNLLMEIRWNGDGGVGNPCWRSPDRSRRVYATDHNASSGSVQGNAQHIRLTIGTMTGVQPTSLGRVKSLFQ